MLKSIVRALYKYSGLQALVSWVDTKVFIYRKRLNIVPVSYKLFLVTLGAVGAFGWHSAFIAYQTEKKVLVFEQPLVINTHAETKEEVKTDRIEELADYIWNKESTKGKNNYSKCEAQGKINGIGFGIPGNGKYMCFESHDEEMVALKGWIVAKKAAGMSEKEMLCLYSGNNYQECKQ